MKFLFRLIMKPFGCLLSLLISLLVLALVAAVAGVLVLNRYSGELLAQYVQQRTGFAVDIAQQDVNFFVGAVDFENVRIVNPQRFSPAEFATFKQVEAKFSIWSLLERRVVVDEVNLDLDSLTVIRPKQGTMNLTDFANGFAGDAASAPVPSAGANPPVAAGDPPPGAALPDGSAPAAAAAPASATRPYLIKKLTIHVGAVKLLDFAQSNGVPKEYDLNYTRTFENVTDLNAVREQLAQDFTQLGLYFLGKDLVIGLMESHNLQEMENVLIQQGIQSFSIGHDTLQSAGNLVLKFMH